MKALFATPLVLASFAVSFAALAKNPPSAGPADIAKAEAGATMTLSSIALSRVALADAPALASAKDTIAGIYDREEAAVKDALAKLKAAGGDKTKNAQALAALDAADDEATKYFQNNPTVKDQIAKRVTLIRNEIGQIAKSPRRLHRLSRQGRAFRRHPCPGQDHRA